MTEQPKFTPGPWRVVIDDDGNPLSGRPGVFSSAELDCGIVHWDGFVQPYCRRVRCAKEIHANAHLIAAAPDMYAALDMQVRNCPLCKGTGKSVDAFTWLMAGEDVEKLEPTDCRWCRSGRAALAKARGQ